MKTIRLTLTDNEYKNVYSAAIENGYSSISEYLRSMLFDEYSKRKPELDKYLQLFSDGVMNMESEAEFRVKDCFDIEIWNEIDISNRKTIGRMIAHKVENDGWLALVPSKRESGNAQWYIKRSD